MTSGGTSESKNVVKTQYIYVNSKNAGDTPYNVKLSIPSRVFECTTSQFFRLTVQDFQMTASWYYVNETNNTFKILYNIVDESTSEFIVEIPHGNYAFKALAAQIQSICQQSNVAEIVGISVVWNSKTNKLEFTFPSADYELDLMNAWYILGFTSGDNLLTPDSDNNKIVSNDILKFTLSDNITLWIDNVTINENYVSVENKESNICEPVTCVLNINNNYAPFDRIKFENSNDLYSIIINEKVLDNLVFSIRDEDGRIMQYVSHWRASIKVETIESDLTYAQQLNMIGELKEVREYLKFIFLQSNLQQK